MSQGQSDNELVELMGAQLHLATALLELSDRDRPKWLKAMKRDVSLSWWISQMVACKSRPATPRFAEQRAALLKSQKPN